MTSDQKEQFRSQGYLVIRDLFSPAEMRKLSAMSDKLLDGELKPEFPYRGKKPDEFYRRWEPEVKERKELPLRTRTRLMSWMAYHHPYFWEVASHPAIYSVLSGLFDSGVKFFSDCVFHKPPHHGVEAAPHQDTAFWPRLEPRAINFWLAIDAATAQNGCLHVVPKSHQRELSHHKDPVQSWILRDDEFDTKSQVPLEVWPGTAIFMDSALIHRSYGNRSDRARRALGLVYVAENVRHVEPWTLEYQFKLVPSGRGTSSGFTFASAMSKNP